MPGGIDALCLVYGTMVHPDDDVLLVLAGRADRDRLVLFVKRNK